MQTYNEMGKQKSLTFCFHNDAVTYILLKQKYWQVSLWPQLTCIFIYKTYAKEQLFINKATNDTKQYTLPTAIIAAAMLHCGRILQHHCLEAEQHPWGNHITYTYG